MRYSNSVPQLIDGNGYIVVGTKYFYDPKSARLKSIYTDSSLTTAQSNPLESDSNGRFSDIFMDGIYREVQLDNYGRVVWSKEIGEIADRQADLWVNNKTYSISDIVQGSDNSYYRSLTSSNQGNNPTTDATNWEKLSLLSLENDTPIIFFNETDASVDNKKWDIRIVSEQFLLRIINDAEDTASNIAEIDRAGTTVTSSNFNGILQSQGNNVLTHGVTMTVQGYDIRPALYSGKFKALTSTGVQGLFMSPSGLKMYEVGTTAGAEIVYSYTLTTAGDVSTASWDGIPALTVTTQESAVTGLTVASDGLNLYIVGSTNQTVYQYTSASAFGGASSYSYASKSFLVSGQDTAPVAIAFKSDGTKMYMLGDIADTVFQYTLSTAWDVSTASYDTVSFSVAAQETSVTGMFFSDDGLSMFIVGSANDTIFKYILGTAWDMTTASYTGYSFSVANEETVPTSITSCLSGRYMYIAGTANDTAYQYNTNYLRL